MSAHFTPPEDIFYHALRSSLFTASLWAFVVAIAGWQQRTSLLAACAAGSAPVSSVWRGGLEYTGMEERAWYPRRHDRFAPIIVGVPVGETPPVHRKEPEFSPGNDADGEPVMTKRSLPYHRSTASSNRDRL